LPQLRDNAGWWVWKIKSLNWVLMSFWVVWKKPKESPSAFWFGFKLACYHWTWKSLTVRAGVPWTTANWLPLPKPAAAPSAL
jgi:hypothetical protein